MRILFFDTETTGLPIWKEPSDHPGQPHIVDLAVELWDDDELLGAMDTIVNPGEGVIIPDDVVALHGITSERAIAEGMPKADAINQFHDLVRQADMIIGHNVSFDIRMVRIETARVTGAKWDNMLPTFCTMRKSTNVCRLIGPKARHPEDWKWPTLGEAYAHFSGQPFVYAHRAGPDVQAAKFVYHELMKLAA